MSRELDIAWLAGILEGEGYFSIERDTTGYHDVTVIRIVLTMTDYDIVERSARIMGAPRVIHVKRPASYKETCKPQYRAKISGDRAIGVLREILPYMGQRRSARIKDQIAAHESRSTWSMGAKRRVARQKEKAAA